MWWVVWCDLECAPPGGGGLSSHRHISEGHSLILAWQFVLHQALVEAGLMLRQYLILLDLGFVCDGLEDRLACAAVVGA